MPSEGLSIDQMCQAVDSFGVSPVLTRVDSFRTARVELFTAVSSGLVPVLVITQSAGGIQKHHAIAVVGAKTRKTPTTRTTDVLNFGADHLEAIYVHDDRIGPYMLARLDGADSGVLRLKIRTVKADRGGAENVEVAEEWKVTHILTPMHAKVRLSISELYRIAREIAQPVGAALQTSLSKQGPHQVQLDLAIHRSYRYLERLLYQEPDFPHQLASRVAAEVSMARYVAVIRLKVEGVGSIDVLVDTTSTRRNPSYFGVICDTAHASVNKAGQVLADQLRCGFFGAEG
jgi:hypothetical protein